MKTIKEVDNFPNSGQACIYFLVKGDAVIYVGQTVELKNRIASHRYVKKLDFDTVKYTPCNLEDMDNLEAINIVKHNPPNNFKLPPNDRFKTFAYLRNRVIKELPKIRTPYSKICKARQPKNTREHYYVNSSDCDNLIKDISDLIERKYLN